MTQTNTSRSLLRSFTILRAARMAYVTASEEPFPRGMKIECAREIRAYPVGTKVRLRVVETTKEDSHPFLYSSYKWKHERL